MRKGWLAWASHLRPAWRDGWATACGRREPPGPWPPSSPPPTRPTSGPPPRRTYPLSTVGHVKCCNSESETVRHCYNTWGRRVRIGFSDRVWRDQPRGHPEGAAGPEGCPRGWSQHTRSEKTYKHEHGRKYWHYFVCMDNHPTGWPLLYETPLGMICLYGKVMLHSPTNTICRPAKALYPGISRQAESHSCSVESLILRSSNGPPSCPPSRAGSRGVTIPIFI